MIILSGGIRDNKALNDVIIFYTYSNQWCPSAPMVRGRYHHACVVVNGNVYVLGESSMCTYYAFRRNYLTIKQIEIKYF